MNPESRLKAILDLARWAPSGDNRQPWTFDVKSPDHVVVHISASDLGIYDLDGRATFISAGALLETMRVAASGFGCKLKTSRCSSSPLTSKTLIDVKLEDCIGPRDPLYPFIESRSVQRRPLSTTPLDAAVKQKLADSLGPGFEVVWFEGWRQRTKMAWLATRSAKIRLTTPEAFVVHQQVIEWDAQFSKDRIPDAALGIDPISLRLMRWVLKRWSRVQLANRFLGGTWGPRLQLELLPGVLCGAHFALVAKLCPKGPDEYLAVGAAMQRFWLTATSLGLQLQPQYSPLAFASYARQDLPFSTVFKARQRAQLVLRLLQSCVGAGRVSRTVFLGRVGYGRMARSRSHRRSLDELTM